MKRVALLVFLFAALAAGHGHRSKRGILEFLFGKKDERHKVPVLSVTHKVPMPYTVTVEKKFAVPVHVAVPRPVPVYVPQPYPVTVDKPVPYPVHLEVPVPYEVEKKVPVAVQVPVERPFPVYVGKPYPVVLEKPEPVQAPAEKPYLLERPVFVPLQVPVDSLLPGSKSIPVPLYRPVAVSSHVPFTFLNYGKDESHQASGGTHVGVDQSGHGFQIAGGIHHQLYQSHSFPSYNDAAGTSHNYQNPPAARPYQSETAQ